MYVAGDNFADVRTKPKYALKPIWNCLLRETRALNYSAFCRGKVFEVLF